MYVHMGGVCVCAHGRGVCVCAHGRGVCVCVHVGGVCVCVCKYKAHLIIRSTEEITFFEVVPRKTIPTTEHRHSSPHLMQP